MKEVAGLPDTISLRYNPGGVFALGTDIMDNPNESKFGMTKEQLLKGIQELKAQGVKHFGVHSFLASNTVTNDYYPELARQLFELAVEIRKKQVLPLILSICQEELGSIIYQVKKPMTLRL